MEIVYLLKHEILLIFLLVLLLITRISEKETDNSSWIKMFNAMFFLNCVAGWLFNQTGIAFGKMFINNELLAFEKNILNTGTLIICLFSSGWLMKQRHIAEFYILLISALLGMFFMLSSGNLLMFFLAVEMSAIPIASLCNFNHDEKRSSEAAMKMIFSSAFSSCIMLLGISFLYGATGTLDYYVLSMAQSSPLFLAGFVFFFTGIVFKLSVVPFHFWTADVYEGSPIATTSFLSVISKGAITFIFMSALYKVFQPMQEVWYNMIVVLAIATMVIGNLFALRQQNIKRFLAFSSIAQVGFILVGISSNDNAGLSSVVYFVLIYTFSNLAAFGVASVIAEQTGKEQINDYKGLYKTNPFLSWVLALALFSLAGIPPTAGFFGKLFLITAGASKGTYWFITIAALNMIVSLYYYLKIVRAMFMDKNEQPIEKIKLNPAAKLGLIICGAGIVLAGILSWVYDYISQLN